MGCNKIRKLQTRYFLRYTNCDYNCSIHSSNKLPIYCFTVSLLTNVACLKLYIKEFGLHVHGIIYLLTFYCLFLLPPQHADYELTPSLFCSGKNKHPNCSPSFFTSGKCIIIIILYRITQLVLWSQPRLRSNCLDQPVHCNEAGWKLPAPLVSCSSAVPCDIHLLSLVWLVNLGCRETLPPLITSAQRTAFNSMNGHGKLCLCHHNQTVPFKSHCTTSQAISYSSISVLL